MDFTFTNEQQVLRDTVRRFIKERYSFEYRSQVRASGDGWSCSTWMELAELGLLALNIPERDGGIGGGPIETMLVESALGEGLLLEPYLSSAVVATRAIVDTGSAEQRRRWLPALASGELIAVLAHHEGSIGGDCGVCVQAVREPRGWRLSGHVSAVYHAPAAGLLLVSARTDEGVLGLFAVAADTPGVRLLPCVTVDDQRAATIELEDAKVAADARLGLDIAAAVDLVLDGGLAALCAEALGAMDKVLAATIEYSRARTQFGAPLCSFQVLRHRMADMLIHLEQARSMSYLAASACTEADPAARRAALCAAKVLMGRSARYIGQQAVQLHGGMGMTDELSTSHYFKRLTAFELRCGTTAQRLARYRLQLQAA